AVRRAARRHRLGPGPGLQAARPRPARPARRRPGRPRRSRLTMGHLQLYVLRQVVLWIVTVLLVFASMELLIDFVAISNGVGARAARPRAGAPRLPLMSPPGVLRVLMPFVSLGGTFSASATPNRRSELTAMRAAGVSAWRFILPAAVTAFLCG